MTLTPRAAAENPEGVRVNYSDYAALEAQHEDVVKERDAYRNLSEGLDKLCAAYRFGRPVSETTFTKIEAARALLARIEKGAGDGR